MTTKRIYGEETKRRTYTVTDEVIKSLGDIGNGNRSKGLRICSGYHGRLVEALRNLEMWAPKDMDAAEDARILLTEIAEAGK